MSANSSVTRSIAGFLALVLLSCAPGSGITINVGPPPSQNLEFYVSPGGNDSNDGSSSSPFASLARARDAVREARRNLSGAAIVHLAGGTYRLASTLELTPADSAITFAGNSGETAVMSGGIPVTGWTQESGGIWSAPLSVPALRQLFVNGNRAERARRSVGAASIYDPADSSGPGSGYDIPDPSIATWKHPEDLELGFINNWTHSICGVDHASAIPGGTRLVMRQPCFYLARNKEGIHVNTPNYIENALELVDGPGKWYFDRAAQRLYYWPRSGENLPSASVIAPALQTLVFVHGSAGAPVRKVGFDHVTFAHATWVGPTEVGHPEIQANFIIRADNTLQRRGQSLIDVHNEYSEMPAAIELVFAADGHFERCNFTALGGAGLNMDLGAQRNTVSGGRFFDISGSAIQVGGVTKDYHHPSDPSMVVGENTVTNNYVHDVGVEFLGSVGIFLGYTRGTTVAHNEITRLPYSGISSGWGWGEEDPGGGQSPQPFNYDTPTTSAGERIQSNHIHQVMVTMSDGAGIYTLGAQPGTIISQNHIHANPHNPGGIYTDEGSAQIEVTANVVYDVPTPMFFNNNYQNKNQTINVHDNFFGSSSGAGAAAIIAQAGIEPAYSDILR